jgi:hypothetical protein
VFKRTLILINIILSVFIHCLNAQNNSFQLNGSLPHTINTLRDSIISYSIKANGDSIKEPYFFRTNEEKYRLNLEYFDSTKSVYLNIYPKKILTEYIKTVGIDEFGNIFWAYSQLCDECKYEKQIDSSKQIYNVDSIDINAYKKIIKLACKHFNIKYE